LAVAYVSSSLGSRTQMITKRAKQLAKDLQVKPSSIDGGFSS